MVSYWRAFALVICRNRTGSAPMWAVTRLTCRKTYGYRYDIVGNGKAVVSQLFINSSLFVDLLIQSIIGSVTKKKKNLAEVSVLMYVG